MITEKQIILKLYGPYFRPSIPAGWLKEMGLAEGDKVEVKITKMGTKPVISIGKV